MEKRIPRRRFKEFIGSGDWEEKKLGEMNFTISDGNYGELYPKSYEILTEGVPFIRVNNIKNGYLTKENLVYISSKLHTILTSGHLEKDDILITTRGEIGKIAIVDESFINANINAQICLIRTGINMNSKYLHQYLQTDSSYKKIISLQTGSALKQLPRKRLSDIELVFPSLAEQEKIGHFFQKLDRLIEINREKLDKLKASKSAYLTEMFPGEGEDRPRRRFQGFTGDWQEDKAKDICSISTGKSNTQDRNSDGKYPFYVRSPRIECSTKYLYNEEAVLTVGDGVGTGKVFHYVNGKYDLHQRVYRMFNFNNIMAKYFYYYFSVKFYDRVMSMTARTSVDSVRYEMISEMNILYPSMEEQIKIVKLLETFDQQIEVQEEKLEKLEKMKKAYLAEMFV